MGKLYAASVAEHASGCRPIRGGATGASVHAPMIVDALPERGRNKSRAAAALGLSRTRFYTRLRNLGLAP
jgi:transcriptional regulator of acetoin/glycerol metabolism